MPHDIHAGLAAYLTSRQVADLAPGSDGNIILNLDSSLRVHCRPLAQRELLLDSRVVGLPRDATERDEAVMKAMRFAAERMRDKADVLVMAENGRSLRLQQRVDAGASSMEVEVLLGEFVDAVEFYRAHLGRG